MPDPLANFAAWAPDDNGDKVEADARASAEASPFVAAPEDGPATENRNALPSRMPPHSEEAEKSLLGAILIEPDTLTEVGGIIEPDDFYATAHRSIFRAMLATTVDGARSDATVVMDRLKRDDKLERVGGEAYLASIAAFVPSAAGACDYARIIRAHAVRRRVIHGATELQTAAYGNVDIAHLMSLAENHVLSIDASSGDGEPGLVGEMLNEVLEELNTAMAGGGVMPGVAYGLNELDDATGGMVGGQLIIAAGRPGMGKSALAMNIADNVASIDGKGVAVFTLEVSSPSVVKNILARRSQVNVSEIHSRCPRFDDSDIARLTEAAGELMHAPIYIDDDGGLTTMSLRAKATRLKARLARTETPLGLIVVDYLQLMEGGRAETRQLQLAAISRALKRIAKELDVPVLALSQLNRGVEDRQDKRPRLSDLRESGAIEQDADVVLMLYRDEYYNGPASDDPGVCEINIAKQRNGPTRRARAAFIAHHLQFGNLAGSFVDESDATPSMRGKYRGANTYEDGFED